MEKLTVSEKKISDSITPKILLHHIIETGGLYPIKAESKGNYKYLAMMSERGYGKTLENCRFDLRVYLGNTKTTDGAESRKVSLESVSI